MEISVTNRCMDLYFSKLYIYRGRFKRLYEEQSSVVECVNFMKDELSQLKLLKESDTLRYSCNEEVEITDKLLESIKSFKKLFIGGLIREYVLFSYDQPKWLKSLNLSCGSYLPTGLHMLLYDIYMPVVSNELELDIFDSFNNVVTSLFCRGDSHVGPYRISKKDMLGFDDFVYNISQCANGRLYSIVEALQIVHLQQPSFGITASNRPGQFVILG